MEIKINDNELLSIKIRYNREAYNNITKGFILYVTKYTIKEENGYITKTTMPMDKSNFWVMLKEQNRYSKKTENAYNEFINNNIKVLTDLYLKNDYVQIKNLVTTAI